MTNADKIRAMTDEELIKYFRVGICSMIQMEEKKWCRAVKGNGTGCFDCQYNWLKQEVEDDN